MTGPHVFAKTRKNYVFCRSFGDTRKNNVFCREFVNTRSTKELNAFFAFGESLPTSATLAVAVVVVVVATAAAIKHPHGVQSGQEEERPQGL